MNLESSRSVPTSIRTRRTVRNLAIALIATIPLAACSSGASDDPRADDVAEPIGPTTTAGDDVDPRPAATLPPESSAPATVAPPAGARSTRSNRPSRSVSSRLVTPGTVKQSVRWWPTTP